MRSHIFTTKVLILLIFCISSLNAQQRKDKKFILDSSKPVVYLEFLRLDEENPLYVDDSKEKVWLKFVNNTKWSVYISKFSYGDNGEKSGIHFETERINQEIETYIPKGYKRGHTGSPSSELKSGKSIIFSVPKNYLAENLQIRINYNFDWDYSQEDLNYRFSLPVHSIYFTHSDLENYLNEKSLSNR